MEDLASRIASFGHTILLPLLCCLQKYWAMVISPPPFSYFLSYLAMVAAMPHTQWPKYTVSFQVCTRYQTSDIPSSRGRPLPSVILANYIPNYQSRQPWILNPPTALGRTTSIIPICRSIKPLNLQVVRIQARTEH